jgi:hypothetical protein
MAWHQLCIKVGISTHLALILVMVSVVAAHTHTTFLCTVKVLAINTVFNTTDAALYVSSTSVELAAVDSGTHFCSRTKKGFL